MKRKSLLAAALALALALPVAAMGAADVGSANVVHPKDKTHDGTYYAAGQNVTVDGTVNGDVICGAQTVTINGSVNGDVLCAAQTLTINGPVSGSVRSAAQNLTINGDVTRNVTVAAQIFELAKDAKADGEVAVAAQQATLRGPVGQAAFVGVQNLLLDGKVGRSVTAYVDTLKLGPDASIGGNLDYTSEQQYQLDGTKVEGNVRYHEPAHPVKSQTTVESRLSALLFWVAAALAGVMLAIWLAPRMVRSVTDGMIRRWPAALGWGALALLAGPVALLIIAITVIGLPLAIVLGILWFLAIFTSGLFAGVAVGRLTWQKEDSSRKGLALAALVGVPLVLIASWLPWIGGLIGLVAAAWALGGMLLAANRARALG